MTTPNEIIVRRYLAHMEAREWEQVRGLMHDEHAFHFPMSPVPLDADGHMSLSQEFRKSFDEFKHNIQAVHATDDGVVIRGYMRMKHTAEFQGVPASGRVAEFGFISIVRIEDGKIREEWVEMNGMQLMQAIGAIPSAA